MLLSAKQIGNKETTSVKRPKDGQNFWQIRWQNFRGILSPNSKATRMETDSVLYCNQNIATSLALCIYILNQGVFFRII